MNLIIKFFLILLFLVSNTAFSNTIDKDKLTSCEWDNKNYIPCLKINSSISNTSNLNVNSIAKKIITRKQIEKSGAIDLIDVLSDIPSINITQSGPKGQQASLFMRGSGSNHTLVLINGVAINDQSTTQGLHDFGVDFIQTIQQVEVYEGPTATIFGPNAIGGAINIITTGDYKDYASIYKGNKENINFLINKNHISEDLTAINFKFGGVKNNTNSAKFGGKENDKVQNLTGNFNLEKWINDIQIKNSIYLRQTVAEYDNSASDEIGYEGNNKMLSTQFFINKLKKNSKNQFTLFYNLYDREYDEKNIIDYYDSNSIGAKYDFSNLLNNKFSYGYGSEYRYDDGEFKNNGSYTSSTKGYYDNLSVYGNLGYNFFNNSNLSFFIRSDRNKKTGNNQSSKINLDQKYKIFNFGFNRSHGFRNPTIYELYGTDSYGYSGNKDLKPEKSISNEIYLKFNFLNNLNGSIRGFKTNIYDQIEYENNKYINRSDNLDLKQSGINSEINFNILNYKIDLFSSFLSSEKVDGSAQLRRPEKTYGFNLIREFTSNYFGKFNMSAKYNHYGKHFDTHSSTFATVELGSTDIVNLSISKKIGEYDFYLHSANILNEKYQRPHGYSQNGRLFNIGFKLNY